jgi:hypothetical protein
MTKSVRIFGLWDLNYTRNRKKEGIERSQPAQKSRLRRAEEEGNEVYHGNP